MPDSYLKSIGFKGKKLHKNRQSNVLQPKKRRKNIHKININIYLYI
jgi:hypothetical protein